MIVATCYFKQIFKNCSETLEHYYTNEYVKPSAVAICDNCYNKAGIIWQADHKEEKITKQEFNLLRLIK